MYYLQYSKWLYLYWHVHACLHWGEANFIEQVIGRPLTPHAQPYSQMPSK